MEFDLTAITQWVPLRTLIFLGIGLVFVIAGGIVWEFWLKKQQGGIIGTEWIDPLQLIIGFIVTTFGLTVMYLYSKGVMMVWLPYLIGMIVVGTLIYYLYYKYRQWKGETR